MNDEFQTQGKITVNNNGNGIRFNIASFVLGALVVMQIAQIVAVTVLYFYIHSLEGRCEERIRESGKAVIEYLGRRE